MTDTFAIYPESFSSADRKDSMKYFEGASHLAWCINRHTNLKDISIVLREFHFQLDIGS